MGVVMMKKPSYGYSKLDKEDPDEIIHRRAQFLIYKALKQADSKRKSSFFRFSKLKVKIGRKLKRFRKGMLSSISAARVRFYKQIVCQLKRLFESRDTIATVPAILAIR